MLTVINTQQIVLKYSQICLNQKVTLQVNSSKIICNQVRTLPVFCDQQILHKVESTLRETEHALYGEFDHLGTSSGHWHTKPTEEETILFPLQFESSTGHDQPSGSTATRVAF